MRGARSELPPLRPDLAAALLAALVAAAPAAQARAQSNDGDARAATGAWLGTSRIAGSWVGQAEASFSIRVLPWLEVGGAGRIDLHHPTIENQGSSLRVRFGYGGLELDAHPRPMGRDMLRVGVLLGAGNLDVQDPAVGTVLDSDNGAVIEPSVSLNVPLVGKLAARAAGSWRVAVGFEALGGLGSRNLSGPALLLGLAVGPF